MNRTELQIWIELNDAVELGRVEPWIEGVADLLAGVVCPSKIAFALPDWVTVTYRADTPDEVRELLERNSNLFVPQALTESLWTHRDYVERYEGEIWLADQYVARHLVEHRLDLKRWPSLGFVGRSPDLSGPPSSRYALLCEGDADRERILSALRAGVEHVWLRPGPATLVEQLQRIVEIADAAELARLFAGMGADDLDEVWAERLCLVARRDLPVGHVLAEDDFEALLRSDGISADLLERVVGRRLGYMLLAGSTLSFGVLEC